MTFSHAAPHRLTKPGAKRIFLPDLLNFGVKMPLTSKSSAVSWLLLLTTPNLLRNEDFI
jgi:hypothetical protein